MFIVRDRIYYTLTYMNKKYFCKKGIFKNNFQKIYRSQTYFILGLCIENPYAFKDCLQ